ncbi:MAG: hypothetical protein IJ176_05515 [Prevotella sp.]|nr:hypothetical protein [Prevotella sp.]
MKKITFLTALLCMAAFSVKAQTTALSIASLTAGPAEMNIAVQQTPLPQGRFVAPFKAPIAQQPQGKSYELSGNFTGGLYSGGQVSVGSYSRVSKVVEGDDGCIYIYNLPTLLGAQTWVKAEPVGGDIIEIRRQVVYEAYGTEYVLVPMRWQYTDEATGAGEFVEIEDGAIQLYYKDGVLRSVAEDPFRTGVVIGSVMGSEANGYSFTGRAEWNLNYAPITDVKATLPEGLETEEMVMRSISSSDMSTIFAPINVAITDDAVYLNVYEDAYVKGTIDGDKVTFMRGQYLGANFYYGYAMYFEPGYIEEKLDENGEVVGLQALPCDKIVLDYDREERSLKSDSIWVVNAGQINGAFYGLSVTWAPYIKPFKEVAAVPCDPVITAYNNTMEQYGYNSLQFNITTADVDDNYILPEKMAWRAFIDGELFIFSPEDYAGLEGDMEEIPYGFMNSSYDIYTSFFTLPFYPEESVGLQVIYRGCGETNYSNIVTIDVNTLEITTEPYLPTGIEKAESQSQVTAVVCHDMAGRLVSPNAKGLKLMTLKRADGTQKTVKMIR